jgi:hypothetical protein
MSQQVPNIAASPSIVTRSSEIIWLPAWHNANGDVIRTSDDKLPILPLMEPVSIAVFHIHKFKPYGHSQFKAEINALNSSTWYGWTAGQAWISKIISEGLETIGNTTGETVHYVVRCIDRENGWKVEYPDVNYSETDYTTPVEILNERTKKEINFNSVSGLE